MSTSNTKVSGKMMVLRRKVLLYATVVISSPKICNTHQYHKYTPETPDLVMYVFDRFILGRYLMLVGGMVFYCHYVLIIQQAKLKTTPHIPCAFYVIIIYLPIYTNLFDFDSFTGYSEHI